MAARKLVRRGTAAGHGEGRTVARSAPRPGAVTRVKTPELQEGFLGGPGGETAEPNDQRQFPDDQGETADGAATRAVPEGFDATDATDGDGDGDGEAPENETKRERFMRLVEPRLNRSLNAMRVLGHLAKRGSYEYRDNEAKQIVELLQNGVDEIANAFSESATKTAATIVFDD